MDPATILGAIKLANMLIFGAAEGVAFFLQQMRILKANGDISDELYQQILDEAKVSDTEILRIRNEALAKLRGRQA